LKKVQEMSGSTNVRKIMTAVKKGLKY